MPSWISSKSTKALAKRLNWFSTVALTIRESNVVFVYRVPLFQDDLVVSSAGLCRNKLLEVSDCVIRVALHTNLLAQAIVASDFQHFVLGMFLKINERVRMTEMVVKETFGMAQDCSRKLLNCLSLQTFRRFSSENQIDRNYCRISRSRRLKASIDFNKQLVYTFVMVSLCWAC